MLLPSEKECYELFEEFHTPQIVRLHSEQVAKVAKTLAEAFVESGKEVNVDLCYKAGLLHDLLRVVDIANFELLQGSAKELRSWQSQRKKYAKMHHAEAAQQVLLERGYPELAKTIERHKAEAVFDSKPFATLADKIVFYADKRVAHGKIVSLEERITEALGRYGWQGKELERVKTGWEKMRVVEQELFAEISIGPEDLSR
ncbi:MAG: HD domain-containing protein [Candidatus Gracilibacteria bacterium]|nr:HD domain-containing protein [Candidatus Gracilibacteria bacterium]